MRHQCLILILIVVLSLSCTPAGSEDASGRNENATGEIILKQLSEEKAGELNEYIKFLDYELDKSHLSDKEIDLIIKELLRIQESDPYQKEASSKGGKRLVYPNRGATHQCIFRFRFQKIANRLRALPMEERIAEIVEGMINPPKLKYATTGSFAKELVIAGKQAVPFMVQHKPKQPYLRRQIVRALAEIGDPRGIPYIVEVLRTDDDTFRFARPDAAKGLARFREEKVIAALIAALKDQTYEDIDRHMPQLERSAHMPYVGRYYSVQHAASMSLSQITGHDWGLLYNEDHKTWSAWFNAEKRKSFSPLAVERTEKEMRIVIEFLFHRYMSARPNPWQPQNVLATPEGIKSISEDLKPLGGSVVPILLKVCDDRVANSPLWRDELQGWTKKLLLSLPWDEATRSARRIGEEKTNKPDTGDGK